MSPPLGSNPATMSLHQRRVDWVHNLSDGIVESGRHEELVELKGLYYAMWRQQIGERGSRDLQFASGARAKG